MDDKLEAKYRLAAKLLYHSEGDIEIPDDAFVSGTEPPVDGAYVSAWVWVDTQDAEQLGEDEE